MTSLLQPRPKLPKAISSSRFEHPSGKGGYSAARPGQSSKGQGKQGKSKGKPNRVQWLTEAVIKGEKRQGGFRATNVHWAMVASSIMVVLIRLATGHAANLMEHWRMRRLPTDKCCKRLQVQTFCRTLHRPKTFHWMSPFWSQQVMQKHRRKFHLSSKRQPKLFRRQFHSSLIQSCPVMWI